MEKNFIEKYELVDGHVIMDINFAVITANEEMYRFIGITTDCSIIEIIHQVDLDDFMNVAHNLRDGQASDMVLRMRRSDNSYRWMLVNLSRFQYRDSQTQFDYYELNASDILALKKQNSMLQNNLLDFRHLLAMENELFFVYDYKTNIYKVNNFIDNEIHNIIEMDIDELRTHIVSEKLISEDSIDSFNAYINDMKEATVSYSHTMKTNFITKKADFDTVEFRGSTIYKKNKPSKAVGSIRNSTDSSNYSSVQTYTYNNSILSYDDINKFCHNNITYNSNCEFALILMEFDNWDNYINEEGTDKANRIYDITLQTINNTLGYRGTVCKVSQNLLCIAIRDINQEIYLRAFIESLRTLIKWNVRLMGVNANVTFSIGVARYPLNGKDFRLLNKKLEKALEIANNKGHNRYIIYKEHLHGEMEL